MLAESQIAAFKKAFIDDKADYIVYDGWISGWQRDAIAAGEKDGYLEVDENTSKQISDDQYTGICYRPTKKLMKLLCIAISS